MKEWLLPLIVLLTIVAISCNNDRKNDTHIHTDKAPKTLEDSLMKQIDDGHIVGMSKMAKLHKAQQQAKRVLDSIALLPAKAKHSAESFVIKLNDAIKDLAYADFAMDKWMTEFEMDSAKDNVEQRLKYLTDEKMKVEKMKEAILNSLQKADSLFKYKN